MIAIILEILKWIGIVLASLLGLVLLILALVLFVPFRYRISFQRTGIDSEPVVSLWVKVSYLFSFFRLLVKYPSKVYVKAKFLFFTIFSLPDSGKKKNKKRTKKNSDGKEKRDRKEEINFEPLEDVPDAFMEQADEQEAVPDNPQNEEGAQKTELNHMEEGTDNPEGEKFQKIGSVILKVFTSIRGFFQKIQSVVEKLQKAKWKAEKAAEKINYYKDIFESDTFKQSFRLCKKEILGILKSITPKKVDIYLEIGLEDPSATASILSYYGMLYPWIYDKVRIVGNFEEPVIKGKGLIKGKIRISTVLFAGLKIYFNKDIRKLLRLMKKEEHQNGRK